MTADLLGAECVIQHLNSLKIISMRDWQDRNSSDHDYSVYFDNPNKPGDVRLQIIKRSDKCFIPRSIVMILSYRHYFNAENILLECAV